MRKSALNHALRAAACALLLPLGACTAGEGPIGIAAIGGREAPGGGTEGPQGRSGGGSTPVPTAAPTSTSSPTTDSGAGSSGGGSSTNLAEICSGSFDCDGARIRLTTSSGKCTFTVDDLVVVMNPDQTLTLPTGESAGTWTGGAAGFTVTGGPTNRMTVCKPATSDGGN